MSAESPGTWRKQIDFGRKVKTVEKSEKAQLGKTPTKAMLSRIALQERFRQMVYQPTMKSLAVVKCEKILRSMSTRRSLDVNSPIL